jgi:heptosyltransferase II
MKILAIQNRMGIGDMVIFLPFIEAISKKFVTPVSILVKKNSKAIQFLSDNNSIDQIIILDRDNKSKNGRHDGIMGSLRLINDLKKHDFDIVFIFNSSFRFYIISKIAKIKMIYQYPLFKKKNQHIINTAKKFLKDAIDMNVENAPQIFLSKKIVESAKKKYAIDKNQTNILLGIGGSGDTKRIPPEIFIEFMKLVSKKFNCKFFLATGQNKEEQIILSKILDSEFKNKCFSLDKFDLKETLPIIKNCKISICNDSSFSHLSSALGIETIVLMSDTPLIYGNYNPKMHPIIPDGEKTVTHNTLGKIRINPIKIFEKFKEIIN